MNAEVDGTGSLLPDIVGRKLTSLGNSVNVSLSLNFFAYFDAFGLVFGSGLVDM